MDADDLTPIYGQPPAAAHRRPKAETEATAESDRAWQLKASAPEDPALQAALRSLFFALPGTFWLLPDSLNSKFT